MKISLDWIRDYVDLPEDSTPQQLAERLTMSTVEVEQIVDLAKPLERIVVGRVRAVEPHPSSDALRVAAVDAGSATHRVVCGATNVAPGMKVALALEGAVAHGVDGREKKVRPSEIRGVHSSAMICSAGECRLEDAFDCGATEILDLSELDAEPGTALATAIGYDDFVLEIDNKSLTNRPDLWGHHGIARELAALYDRPLAEPPAIGSLPGSHGFEVRIAAPELCRRYTATRVTGVSAAASPAWIRVRLAKVGQRAINLLVDLTNYVMFAVGQPTHAFDARDIENRIEVRRARAGERLVLLDDKDIELDPEVLVIANERVPIGLAGVMGGKQAIRTDTEEIWLEAANFEPVGIRRTARRFGLRTESSTRFEKGIDIQRIPLALRLFLSLLSDVQPASRVVQHEDVIAVPSRPIAVDVPVATLQRKLGIELSAAEMRSLLERLQFGCIVDDGLLRVSVPSWRATGDVSLAEDIVEEVARLYGYDRLTFTPPLVRLEKPVIQPRARAQRRVREYLAFRAGMRETVSYPWTTIALLEAAGISVAETIGLAHPPAADLRLAPSLIPNLLATVALNLRHRQSFRIFELARVFLPRHDEAPATEGGRLPSQPHHVAAAFVGTDAEQLFLEAKGVLARLDRSIQVTPLTFASTAGTGWGDPAAQLAIIAEGRTIGALAIASARARRKSGIRRAQLALFELEIEGLSPLPSRDNLAQRLPTYPQVELDISMIVPNSVTWTNAREIASQTGDERIREVTFVDEYIGPQVPAGHKSLTLRLHLGSEEGTLVREQIDEIAGRVSSLLTRQLTAVIRKE
jgi:phenylalanyl-tRNA synthetase beta chain